MPDAFLQVDASQAFQLQLDQHASGRPDVTLPAQLEDGGDGTAVLRATLRTQLAPGTYTCRVLLHGQPVATSVRQQHAAATQQLWASSSGSMAGGVSEYASEYSLVLHVQNAQLALSSGSVAVPQMWPNQDDGVSSTDGRGGLFVKLSPGPDAAGGVDDDVSIVSAVLSVACARAADSSEASASSAVFAQELEIDYDAGAPRPVVLPQPGSECGAVRVRVTWLEVQYAQRQRLVFGDADDFTDADVSRPLVVRIESAAGAAISARHQAALVQSSGGDATMAQPLFVVSGGHVVHRGGKLQFVVTRSGGASDLPSTVAWRIVPVDTSAQNRLSLAMASELWDAAVTGSQPAESLQAALGGGAHGTLTWLAGNKTDSKSVTAAINWSAVPYSARALLTVQLSIVSNGRLGHDAGRMGRSRAEAWLSSNSSNAAEQSWHAVVYGVPQDASPLGYRRVSGGPVAIPLPERLPDSELTSRGLLGFFAVSSNSGSNSSSVGASGAIAIDRESAMLRFTAPTPPYNGRRQAYALAFPHDDANAHVALVIDKASAVAVRGCTTVHDATNKVTWAKDSPSLPGLAASAKVVQWQPTLQAGASCTAHIEVCRPGSEANSCQQAQRHRHSFQLTVTRLADPALAALASVRLSVAGESGPVCGQQAAATADSGKFSSAANSSQEACNVHSRARINADPSAACEVPRCAAVNALRATVLYQPGESIEVAVAPLPAAATGSTLTIGQRKFRFTANDTTSGSSRHHSKALTGNVTGAAATKHHQQQVVAKASFTLFDEFDVLSPFMPFVMRRRSAHAAIVDVPMTLTLPDGMTSMQQTLTLLVNVTNTPLPPPPPPPHSHSAAARDTAAPSDAAPGNESNAGSAKSSPPEAFAAKRTVEGSGAADAQPSNGTFGIASAAAAAAAAAAAGGNASPRNVTLAPAAAIPVASLADLVASEPAQHAQKLLALAQHTERRVLQAVAADSGQNSTASSHSDLGWPEDPAESLDVEACLAGTFTYTYGLDLQ